MAKTPKAADIAADLHADEPQSQPAPEPITVADRDPTGSAPNAANYDPPTLPVDPSTPEFHVANPAAITSGQYNPREESAEAYAERTKPKG